MPENIQHQFAFALFNLGFRPFFLGAAIHAVTIVGMWMLIYAFNMSFPLTNLTVFQWHAHEMIFGYTMAVIAGFLLTAVKNWTGIQTIHGCSLIIVFGLWLVARILFIAVPGLIHLAAVFDLLFVLSLILAVSIPIVKTHNWRQLGILSKLILLGVFNACFYAGYAGVLEQGVHWGIYGGLYLIIGLVLTMGSRVIPFFIERGVGYPVKLHNPMWTTILGMLLYLVFFISELFLHLDTVVGYATIGLFSIYAIRLATWHTPGIWKKPLLWSLYLAYAFIVTGFLLFALSVFAGVSKYLAIHMFAYGGIGLITISMMTRVSLGHTGRNINQPPKQITFVFILLIAGVLARVALPAIDMQHYYIWMFMSQLLWIAAFLLFSISFYNILITKRIDGQPG